MDQEKARLATLTNLSAGLGENYLHRPYFSRENPPLSPYRLRPTTLSRYLMKCRFFTNPFRN